MKLSTLAVGRDNNFNLIRMLAALAVLLAHSFPLATGTVDGEPLRKMLGVSLGTIAVDVFFVTSGFLVTASLIKRGSLIEFAWARILRIFPALYVMIFFCVFPLGLYFTTVPWPSYLADHETHVFLIKCATLITGAGNELPGVFETNPYGNGVNGSLWTMPYEVRMYAILGLVWLALRYGPEKWLAAFPVATITLTSLAGCMAIYSHFYVSSPSLFLKLFFMFSMGASYYVLKDRVILSGKTSLALLGIVLLALLNKQIFFPVYALSLPYILLYLAYVPAGLIRKFNLAGDYSYGVYIYAFPMQQAIAALIPGVSVPSMMLISAISTLFLAAISWHFIERRALEMKELYVDNTKKLIARISGLFTKAR